MSPVRNRATASVAVNAQSPCCKEVTWDGLFWIAGTLAGDKGWNDKMVLLKISESQGLKNAKPKHKNTHFLAKKTIVYCRTIACNNPHRASR